MLNIVEVLSFLQALNNNEDANNLQQCGASTCFNVLATSATFVIESTHGFSSAN
jgi:hypothetical protein